MTEQLPENRSFELADHHYSQALEQFHEFQKRLEEWIEEAAKNRVRGLNSLEHITRNQDESRIRFLGEIYAIRLRCHWDGSDTTSFFLQSYVINQTDDGRYVRHRELELGVTERDLRASAGGKPRLSWSPWEILSRILAPADNKANR